MDNFISSFDNIIPNQTKHVLIASLNWGLGHATRCIPIIRYLLSENIEVTIASDGEALELLQAEFPYLASIDLPGYKVSYKSHRLLDIILRNIPNVIRAIITENSVLKDLAQSMDFDLIISDSRFGFRHNSIKSYIISHQLKLQGSIPLMTWCMNYVNQKLINAFDLCLIPDYKDHRLSGALSQNRKVKNKVFIGALSRLKKYARPQLYDKTFILSGPEPARTKLESQILDEIEETKDKILIVRGTELSNEIINDNPNIEIKGLLNSQELNDIIMSSALIISRSGYTSIMDYYALGLKAHLIPTAGQPEQEYLAKYIDGNFGMKHVEFGR